MARGPIAVPFLASAAANAAAAPASPATSPPLLPLPTLTLTSSSARGSSTRRKSDRSSGSGSGIDDSNKPDDGPVSRRTRPSPSPPSTSTSVSLLAPPALDQFRPSSSSTSSTSCYSLSHSQSHSAASTPPTLSPPSRPRTLRSSRSAVSLRNAYNRLRAPLSNSALRPRSSAAPASSPSYFDHHSHHIPPPPGHDVNIPSPPRTPDTTAKTSSTAASPPARAQTAPVDPRPPTKQRSYSFRQAIMSGTAKTSASKFFHDKLGSHHPHLPRSAKTPPKVTDDPDYKRKHEEEKHFICQFDKDNQKEPLSPSQIARDPSEKQVGKSSRYLKKNDFKLVKTIGTGTFARVWLAKLAQPQQGDESKVFALKVLRKVDVIKLKQVEHVRNERAVLAAVAGHPFITTMVASFHDAENLYMIMDYCPGGEIFTYLRRYKKFEESTAQFYSAEVVMILEFLHEEGVAYRDLKPENILIDAEGHLKLVDFGFAKKLDGRQTWTLCGTPEYLAPETIRNTGHGRAVDWWAFGILVYEFLVGQPPFWDDNPMKLYEQIVKGKIHYSTDMTSDSKDLISKLCETDPTKRLGNLRGGANDVKEHAWFKDTDFGKLYKRECKGPILPTLKGHDDTRNFESYEGEPERRTVYTPDLHKKYDSMFECF